MPNGRGFNRTVRKHLSESFKQIRQEQNITIPEISLTTDLSIENIENIEKGLCISFEKYKALAFYYGKK